MWTSLFITPLPWTFNLRTSLQNVGHMRVRSPIPQHTPAFWLKLSVFRLQPRLRSDCCNDYAPRQHVYFSAPLLGVQSLLCVCSKSTAILLCVPRFAHKRKVVHGEAAGMCFLSLSTCSSTEQGCPTPTFLLTVFYNTSGHVWNVWTATCFQNG